MKEIGFYSVEILDISRAFGRGNRDAPDDSGNLSVAMKDT
jgi:hypothetical protein